MFSWSVSRISPVPPPNSVWNTSLEVLVDGVEGLGELLARDQVDLLDGLFGVADGIEQVLPLRAQEVVALLRFLELLERLRVHRAEGFDRLPHLVVAAARPRRCASASGIGSSGAGQLLPPRSSAPCGWSRPGTSARPACAPAPLRSACASHTAPAPAARSTFSSSSPLRSASRMPVSSRPGGSTSRFEL